MDFQNLFDRKLIMVTGKGGIGKTFWSSALAWYAATELGKKVLLVESVASSQIAPLFGSEISTHQRVTLAPGLTSRNFEAQRNFEEYVVRYLGQRMLYDKVFSNRLVRSMINFIPGLRELLLLGRLYYYAELSTDERPDLMIFDGYASGHFLSLVSTPDAVLGSQIGGPIQSETQRVRDFLADQTKVATVFVAVPEDLVVTECLDFMPKLAGTVAHVIMNRMPPAPSSQSESPAHFFAAEQFRRAEAALTELRRRSPNVPVTLFPELGFIEEPVDPKVFRSYWQGRTSL